MRGSPMTANAAVTKATGYTRWRSRLSERFGENRPARDPEDLIDRDTWFVTIFTLVILGGVTAVMVLAVIDFYAKN